MEHSALQKFPCGMYLLTAREDGKDYGCLVNTVMQVSSKPYRIALCVVKKNLTHEILLRTGCFTLSGITEDAPFALFRNFGMTSCRKHDKFANLSGLARDSAGRIYSEQFGNMYLCAKITEQVDLDDHTLFIAEVTDSTVLCDKPTCTYDYFTARIISK